MRNKINCALVAKKKVFVLLSLVMSMSMSAGVTIQSTFHGCTLGKSSKSEVLKKMLELGAVVGSYEDSTISFSGLDFSADGIDFLLCSVSFTEDTMSTILFVGDKRKISAVQLAAVKEKYSKLPMSKEDEEDLKEKCNSINARYMFFFSDLRAYKDNTNSLFTMSTDSLYMFIYSADEYIGRVEERHVMDKIIKTTPNYDETNAVKSVAGCVFGDSRQDVIAKFRSKADDMIDSNAHSVLFKDVSFGGQHFKRGILYFINDKFVACTFESEFYTFRYEEAKATYDVICSQYNRKYTNGVSVSSETDDMLSTYGMLQDDYENGKIPPIIIHLQKSVSRGGDMYYYVSVSYFIERLKTMYDDEI